MMELIVVILTDCLNMTIAVDWDVKLQTKKTDSSLLNEIFFFLS